MRRWHGRLVREHGQAHLDLGWSHEFWDTAFAFFQNAYHLKDWIIADRPDLATTIEATITGNPSLRYCADICNGTKHRAVDRRHRIPGHLAPIREYAPHEPTRQRLHVIGPEGPQPVLDLADDCLTTWDQFIATHLEPATETDQRT
ncbi:hypothetical protein ACG83_03545 [Frankia sp. R43]|nr:hypothetical protein ACG83_03545 [Frankia sp. R43]